MFFSSIKTQAVSSPLNKSPSQKAHSAKLLQDRADELWAGLRRVYFGEKEGESVTAEDHAAENDVLREEIRELMARLASRNRPLESSSHPLGPRRRDDPGDPDPGGEPSLPSSNPIPNP
jgi:hypothetical protein